MIEVTGIKKTFSLSAKQRKINQTNEKLKVAISDVNFYVNKGEIFGLLGSNGAGKTTTLRCIATLIKPDEGNILIDGIDISNDLDVRKKIAFLTNELKLEDQFTPNYIYDYFSKFHNLNDEYIEKRKNELFDKFEITKFAETKIGDLSTGMKQKVSIAVSLVHDPDIIIFDEPTNGLDVITAKVVTDYLIDMKNKGKTIIISTHIMSLVEKICDRIGIIVNGKVKLCDTIENIKNNSSSHDLEEVFFNLYKEELGDYS
ncbi:MAG: ABC transporter ATP-binding protein [Bacilli bacterium]